MELLTLKEVAGKLKVHWRTVGIMIRQGKLRAVDISLGTGERSQWRVKSTDLQAYLDNISKQRSAV